MPKQIIVTMEGGIIQDIEGIPHDVQVVVKDFDVEGLAEGEQPGGNWVKATESGELYFESVWKGKLTPEPPAGTERYFEFYISEGRHKGYGVGFRTTLAGLGSPDQLDDQKIVEAAVDQGIRDAADATMVEEIGQAEYLERYDDGTLAEELAEEDRRDHKRGLYGDN